MQKKSIKNSTIPKWYGEGGKTMRSVEEYITYLYAILNEQNKYIQNAICKAKAGEETGVLEELKQLAITQNEISMLLSGLEATIY